MSPSSPGSLRGAVLLGLRDIAPILIGVVPFGLIYGIAAVSRGIDPLTALAMSSVVFAGASQIAAVDLIHAGAPLAVVVATAWVINLRFVMYSAALAPHFREQPSAWKWLLSYVISDQAFAVSIVRFETMEAAARRAYYLGAAVPLWLTWQLATAAGVFLGAGIPASWSLDFAIPLTFLSLVFPAIRGRPTAAAAVTAAAVAVAARGFPLHLGLMVAAAAGIAVGTWMPEGRR